MLVYGMSKYKLADTLDIPEKEAEEIIINFFKVVPGVDALLSRLRTWGITHGYIMTSPPFKRRRIFEGDTKNFKRKGEIERASMNSPIQGSNADIIKQCMVSLQNRIDRDNIPAQIIMQVYDELQCLVKEEYAEQFKFILEEEMITAAKLVITDIPVIVDIKISNCWSK